MLFGACYMIETDPEKVKYVADWLVPVNQKQLQCFMGLASYYRPFVRSFAQIATPLHALTQKGGPRCVMKHSLN